MVKKCCICLFFLVSAGIRSQVSAVVEEWKKDKELSGASYGICISEAGSGNVLYEYESQRLLVPASTLKIISTYAALKILGAGFRYETQIAYSGNFDKKTGTINGNVMIIGSGDPTLQSELFYAKENVCAAWAKALKDAGVREIKGSIIGEASAFEREVNGDWIWADISNYFGAVPCGLSFMDNKFKLIYNSGASGSQAKLTGQEPAYATRQYSLNSKVMAKGTEDEAYVYGDPFSFAREIKGSIPPGKTNYEVEAALPDPALLCAERFAQALVKEGIKCNLSLVRSSYNKDETTAAKEILYRHLSPPLEKIIYYTNLKSNNLYCESLVQNLGKGKTGDGLEEVKKFYMRAGIDKGDFYLADACGLSRANSARPAAVVKVLCLAASDSAAHRIMRNSFAVAGKSGSMTNIGKGTFIEGNMKAKTGFIGRVRAYGGYVKTRSGKELAFSVIVNNYSCSPKAAKLKIEKLLVAMAEL